MGKRWRWVNGRWQTKEDPPSPPKPAQAPNTGLEDSQEFFHAPRKQQRPRRHQPTALHPKLPKPPSLNPKPQAPNSKPQTQNFQTFQSPLCELPGVRGPGCQDRAGLPRAAVAQSVQRRFPSLSLSRRVFSLSLSFSLPLSLFLVVERGCYVGCYVGAESRGRKTYRPNIPNPKRPKRALLFWHFRTAGLDCKRLARDEGFRVVGHLAGRKKGLLTSSFRFEAPGVSLFFFLVLVFEEPPDSFHHPSLEGSGAYG